MGSLEGQTFQSARLLPVLRICSSVFDYLIDTLIDTLQIFNRVPYEWSTCRLCPPPLVCINSARLVCQTSRPSSRCSESLVLHLPDRWRGLWRRRRQRVPPDCSCRGETPKPLSLLWMSAPPKILMAICDGNSASSRFLEVTACGDFAR